MCLVKHNTGIGEPCYIVFLTLSPKNICQRTGVILMLRTEGSCVTELLADNYFAIDTNNSKGVCYCKRSTNILDLRV